MYPSVPYIHSTHNLLCCRQALSSFTEQPDVIKEVALVKPKPGVFVDEITSLLVICTTSTVLLLGVSSPVVIGPDTRPHREVSLYATDISVTTGEVEMTSVIGMADGRIFMSGSDGHLYELHYQEKEQWFKKKIQLINHTAGGLTSFLPLLQTPASGGMSEFSALSSSCLSFCY